MGSPGALLIGDATTDLSLSTLHALYRDKKARDPLIIAFVLVGIITGLIVVLPAMSVLLRVVPWCGIAALALTACVGGASSRRQIHIKENSFFVRGNALNLPF